jgi:hypothetical protein
LIAIHRDLETLDSNDKNLQLQPGDIVILFGDKYRIDAVAGLFKGQRNVNSSRIVMKYPSVSFAGCLRFDYDWDLLGFPSLVKRIQLCHQEGARLGPEVGKKMRH